MVVVYNGCLMKVNNLWLVGYGEWIGMVLVILIGVFRIVRVVVDEIVVYLIGV